MDKKSEISLVLVSGLCLILALILLIGGLYITLALFFDQAFPLPDMLKRAAMLLGTHQEAVRIMGKLLIILPLFLSSVVFFAMSRYITHFLEGKREDDKVIMPFFADPQPPVIEKEVMFTFEGIHPTIKILLGVLAVLVLLALAEYLLLLEFTLMAPK